MNTNLHKSSKELDLIRHYAKAWTLLQRYDDKTLCIYTGLVGENFTLGYNEAMLAIYEFKKELIQKGEASQIFATQKAGEFEGILKNIYQTFGGCELLPTAQEKAANLIYYIIKDPTHLTMAINESELLYLFYFYQKAGFFIKTTANLKSAITRLPPLRYS